MEELEFHVIVVAGVVVVDRGEAFNGVGTALYIRPCHTFARDARTTRPGDTGPEYLNSAPTDHAHAYAQYSTQVCKRWRETRSTGARPLSTERAAGRKLELGYRALPDPRSL